MATLIDDLHASIAPASLGLGTIGFGNSADQVSAFGSRLGQQLQAVWQRQGGGTGLTAASLRQILPQEPDPGPPKAGSPYSALYVFGDSLSDTGNIAAASGGLAPASPYVGGAFSNGPVWADTLAGKLNLPLPKPSLQGGTDFAYGGAQSGTTAVHPETPIDLPGQLLQFDAQVANPRPDALYAIWAGGNDLFDAVRNSASSPQAARQAVTQAVANVDRMVGSLADRGARSFVVLDAPDLGKTPYEISGGAQQAATATAYSQQFNAALQAALAETAQTRQLKIDLVDTYGLLDSAIANPAAYGFTNAQTPVWDGGFTAGSSGHLAATGAAQNGYVFFDRIHPTTAAQAAVGRAVATSLAA